MSSQKVAIVTGGNKGVGYAIVKGLCKRFDGVVYLAARDARRGEAAVSKIQKETNLKPVFHQLDINDPKSVHEFQDFIKKKHGGIDILINNAAVKNDHREPFAAMAKETVQVNYFGTLRVCDALFPLLRNNAKVVNLSSASGHLSRIPSKELRKQFSKSDLTIPELNGIMERFVQAAENNKSSEEGWGLSSYVVSKVGLTALTIVQQRLFDKEQPNRNISINAVHPGHVDTDMSHHEGPLTIDEGAKSTLFVTLDANLKGKYIWSDCKELDWYSEISPMN